MKAINTTLLILFATLSSLLLYTSCGTKKYMDTSTGWERIAKLEHMEAMEVYVDTTTIKRKGTTIIASEKKVYISPQSREEYYSSIRSKYDKMGKAKKAEKWLDVNYTIYTTEYDCGNRRFRILSVEDYNSLGERIEITTPNKNKIQWIDVEAQTIADHTFFFICDY